MISPRSFSRSIARVVRILFVIAPLLIYAGHTFRNTLSFHAGSDLSLVAHSVQYRGGVKPHSCVLDAQLTLEIGYIRYRFSLLRIISMTAMCKLEIF